MSRLDQWPVAAALSAEQLQAQRAAAAAQLPPVSEQSVVKPEGTAQPKRGRGRPRKHEPDPAGDEEFRQRYAKWVEECRQRTEYIASIRATLRQIQNEKLAAMNHYDGRIIDMKGKLKEVEDWPAPERPTRQK